MARGEHQIKIRFPDDMVSSIRASAEANGRSMNAEVVAQLRAAGVGALVRSKISSSSGREAAPIENPMGLIWEVENISKFIGLNERQTFHILSSGQIPAKKIGGKWVVQLDELKRFFSGKAAI